MRIPTLARMTPILAMLAAVALWRVMPSALSTANPTGSISGDALLEALLENEEIRAKEHDKGEHLDDSPLKQNRQSPRQPIQPDQQASVRIALFKHFPVRRLQPGPGARCRSASGEPIRTIDLAQDNRRGLICQTNGAATIAVNNAAYQGSIELVRHSGQWLAVNQLPIETYVASVVGAEMPSSWNPEALKAQAVAARSYALVHVMRPASGLYHLGDSTRWQVYDGVGSTSASTRRATQATEGQVLQFRGGLVESLYAASAQISAQAHGHLGASMSQTGAQSLAEQGKDYAQILDRYYKGASLARIRLDGD